MSHSTITGRGVAALCLAAGLLAAAPASAQSMGEKWMFTATVYGWVPKIDSTVNFPDDKGSTNVSASMSDVLNHLKMTFQGTFDAHNGRWGMFTDIVYVDLGGIKSSTRNFRVGSIGIPATATTDLSLDLKATLWTIAGEYRVASDAAWTVDVMGGARMMQMKPTLGYSITGDIGPITLPGGRNGSKQVDETAWDGIVGIKGRYTFGDGKWFAPFYVDIGTGQTQLTWQIAGGVGYKFDWGSAFATWRYLDYRFQSGKPLEDITMNGPMLGMAFSW